jgi:hypothetical protein
MEDDAANRPIWKCIQCACHGTILPWLISFLVRRLSLAHMIRSTSQKVSFGTAQFSPIESVKYLPRKKAFEVRFGDGVTIIEPDASIRAANAINPKALFESVSVDEELRQGFYVHYHTGEVAEVSWAFVRELLPEVRRKVKGARAANASPRLPTVNSRVNQFEPELINESSLNWALRHMLRYGDTDVFPIAFEYSAFKAVWPYVLSALRSINLAEHELGPPVRMMVPKHTTGYRSAAQLDPLDALLFTGLVYEMAPTIERFRVPADHRIACAYRLDIDDKGQFFRKDPGWSDFHEQSKANLNDRPCSHVISADVTDFYNQISHYRIQNALSGAGVTENRSKVTERLLANFNALHHSRGIPVGPSASILSAECALADVEISYYGNSFLLLDMSTIFESFARQKRTRSRRSMRLASTYLPHIACHYRVGKPRSSLSWRSENRNCLIRRSSNKPEYVGKSAI